MKVWMLKHGCNVEGVSCVNVDFFKTEKEAETFVIDAMKEIIKDCELKPMPNPYSMDPTDWETHVSDEIGFFYESSIDKVEIAL